MLRTLTSLYAAATLVGSLLVATATQPASPVRFLVDYSSQPGLSSLEEFDQVILDPSSDLTLPAHRSAEAFAYLSLVEVPHGASYASAARGNGLLLKDITNPTWSSTLADITNPAWRTFFVETLAENAVRRGFDGFFLDTADSIHRLPGARDEQHLQTCRQRVAELITSLHAAHPDKKIILNRGFDIIDLLPAGTLDGVLIESLFQTYDHKTKTYKAVPDSDTAALTSHINRLRQRNMPVQIIDYVDPTNPDLAQATARRIEALGASPLISTPDLQGTVLAPNTPVTREILVIHGTDPAVSPADPAWAADTSIATLLQMPLEWMGYELRFHHAGQAKPPVGTMERYAGIMVEGGLHLSPSMEQAYAKWLVAQTRQGRKLLITGSWPFQDPAARQTMFHGLGINGSGELVIAPAKVRITAKDPDLCDFERPIKPSPLGFVDMSAPTGTTPTLRLECQDRDGRTRRFDPVFTTSWGGVLLNPYWRFQPTLEDSLSYVDPFALLQTLWPIGAFPAPDPTTRDGLRLFWSHIDGDGFVTLSTTRRDITCAEVVRDRILKAYPLPTTVSIIEAETRALQETQNPEDVGRFETIAREIFRLPHIEAASHSYSHPFVWSPADKSQYDNYDHHCLCLKQEHAHHDIDPVREVVGSVNYIERELLPPDKKVRIMLWSGNCRPFPEAVRLTQELGIENMNGGFTVHSPRHPSLAAVASRSTWWDDQLQIHAANQNDYVYTKDWSGPLYGGFEQVIDSFKMLDSPRRLKPVNVYYHFYSAQFPGALTALERIHDWVMEQALHPVTASHAASITRGAIMARLHRTGERRWLITGHGALNTFRVPKTAGFPDLHASSNITGFNDHGTERYIHTNGASHVELVLADAPSEHLQLRSSESNLTFRTFAPDHCAFTGTSLKPAPVVFAGVPPASRWTLTIRDTTGTRATNLTADTDGAIAFTLAGPAEVTLVPAPPTTAAR